MKTILAILKDVYGFLFDILNVEMRWAIAAVLFGLIWWWKGLHVAIVSASVVLWFCIAIIVTAFVVHIADDIKKKKEKLGA